MLPHRLDTNRALHDQVVIVTVVVKDVARVPEADRIHVVAVSDELCKVTLHPGFLGTPDVPAALGACAERGLAVAPATTTYYLGCETIIPSERPGMTRWHHVLFAFLVRNGPPATEFYRLPHQRVVEFGLQVES